MNGRYKPVRFPVQAYFMDRGCVSKLLGCEYRGREYYFRNSRFVIWWLEYVFYSAVEHLADNNIVYR